MRSENKLISIFKKNWILHVTALRVAIIAGSCFHLCFLYEPLGWFPLYHTRITKTLLGKLPTSCISPAFSFKCGEKQAAKYHYRRSTPFFEYL